MPNCFPYRHLLFLQDYTGLLCFKLFRYQQLLLLVFKFRRCQVAKDGLEK